MPGTRFGDMFGGCSRGATRVSSRELQGRPAEIRPIEAPVRRFHTGPPLSPCWGRLFAGNLTQYPARPMGASSGCEISVRPLAPVSPSAADGPGAGAGGGVEKRCAVVLLGLRRRGRVAAAAHRGPGAVVELVFAAVGPVGGDGGRVAAGLAGGDRFQ